jgi:hypothetical protein
MQKVYVVTVDSWLGPDCGNGVNVHAVFANKEEAEKFVQQLNHSQAGQLNPDRYDLAEFQVR